MKPHEEYIVRLIKDRVLRKNPDATVILFGSRARGRATSDSDWDVLILLNNLSVSRKLEKEYREELFEVELETGEPISTFVYSWNDWKKKISLTPFYKNVQKDGILLSS